MSFEFKKIYEHDMDLLIMEEFVSDRGFARLFLDKVNLSDNFIIEKATHSLADKDGESDITFVLKYPDRKVGLLLEDKIDAQTMPEQSDRYYRRAKTAVTHGKYSKAYVMLVAPEEYHKEHWNDNNATYEYRVTYEELLKYLQKKNDARSSFKASMIEFAIREKKAGYVVEEDRSVTEFWRRLRQYCKENYPKLDMLGEDTPKGASACWPEFRTSLRTIKVIYKSQKGWVDLELPRYGDRIGTLLAIIEGRMSPTMSVWPTGKSASVRLADESWKIDFTQEFDGYMDVIDGVLQAVLELCEFADKLNYSELY